MAKTFKPYPPSKILDADKTEMYWYNFITTGNPKYFVWNTLNRQAIRLKDLRISHINNILKEMNNGRIRKTYQFVFLNELERRKKNKLIKTKKAGKILYGDT